MYLAESSKIIYACKWLVRTWTVYVLHAFMKWWYWSMFSKFIWGIRKNSWNKHLELWRNKCYWWSLRKNCIVLRELARIEQNIQNSNSPYQLCLVKMQSESLVNILQGKKLIQRVNDWGPRRFFLFMILDPLDGLIWKLSKSFFFSNIFEIKWKTEWSKSNNSRESTVWLFS